MLARTEFLCYWRVSCLCFRTYILIYLIYTAYCDQFRVTGFSLEFPTTEAGQQNTSSNENYTEPSSEEDNGELGSEADYEDYAYFDDNDLSDVAPEVLVDPWPGELILSSDQGPPPRRMKPVKDGFVRDQEMELLRLHNLYRSNVTPPAADMSFMEWDADLAKTAQDWANRCQFRHGFAPTNYSGAMGQNLYRGYDPTGLRALLLWYEEYHDYNMKTAECTGEQCGHYTQMVWGESSLLGCGMKRCGFKNFLVVCHYSPPGNVAGYLPYKVGKPCSQCQRDHGGFCTSNLCVTEEQCSRCNGTCNRECPLECHNCGILNINTCTCRCADGWDSLDCSRRCQNDHDGCGKRDGFPTITYCSLFEHAIANVHCREMCGRCRGIQDLNSTSVCCKGLQCDDGYVIDMKKNLCKCRLLCPGSNCYHGSEPVSKNVSVEDSGLQRIEVSNLSNITDGVPCKNISDDANWSLCEAVLDKGNGSQCLQKNIYIVLLVLAAQMSTLSATLT